MAVIERVDVSVVVMEGVTLLVNVGVIVVDAVIDTLGVAICVVLLV